MALTFDDGPGPYTPKILAVLKAKKVHATFFETGLHVAAIPAMARRVLAEGNRIGNHTYTHPQYTVPGMKAFDTMSRSAQAKELDSTTSAIRAATGAVPCFFRGPGGHQFGATTQSLVKSRRMSNVYWSDVTGDSAQPASYSAAKVREYVALATVRRNSTNHPIILMHDGNATPKTNPNRYRGNTVAALPRIIDYYRARGFVFTDPVGHRFSSEHAAPAVPSAASLTAPQVVRLAVSSKAVALQAPLMTSTSLRGKVVLLDPGHNRGAWSSKNRAAINRKVNIGTGWKACQATGTSTVSGYKESTFTMSVVTYVKRRLEARGAKVYLTRPSDDPKSYGPCIDVRGRMAAKVRANALVSIHGDNEPSRLRGFFVMRPGNVRGWTDDIYASSGVLATYMNHGLRGRKVPVATWYGPGGYRTRTDLGTLNNSDVPAVMIELGNMRNRADAAWMTSASHRNNVYAAGLADGLTRYLLRR